MPVTIPLFPLGAVLFPGSLLPLHVFEERYRELLGDLLRRPPAEQRFGVVAIRRGVEVGSDAVEAVYDVGTVAELRQTSRHPDGRYDILVHGADRFRLLSVDATSRPYLCGQVELLPEPPADAEAAVLAGHVGALFEEYLTALAAAQGAHVVEHSLPQDPTVLSYLVASTALLTLEDRQLLLEVEDTVQRLRRQARLLRRETVLVQTLRVVPAPLREVQVPMSRN